MVATAVCAMVLMARTPAARTTSSIPVVSSAVSTPGRGPGDSGPAQSCPMASCTGPSQPLLLQPLQAGQHPIGQQGILFPEWRSVPCPAPSAAGSTVDPVIGGQQQDARRQHRPRGDEHLSSCPHTIPPFFCPHSLGNTPRGGRLYTRFQKIFFSRQSFPFPLFFGAYYR